VKTAKGRQTGLGAVETGRLQRTITTTAAAYNLPKVAPVEAIWSDTYLPPLAMRKTA
jgi:hypothetical protein